MATEEVGVGAVVDQRPTAEEAERMKVVLRAMLEAMLGIARQAGCDGVAGLGAPAEKSCADAGGVERGTP